MEQAFFDIGKPEHVRKYGTSLKHRVFVEVARLACRRPREPCGRNRAIRNHAST